MENKKKDDTATLTAEACGTTAAYVRMIVRGVRKTDSPKAIKILETYNAIIKAKQELSAPIEADN